MLSRIRQNRLLTSALPGQDESGPEYAKLKPEIVIKSMEEFSKERYAADVLKVDVPIQMAYVEGTKAFQGTALYSREDAKRLLREAASKADQPIVYLSAGVSSTVFLETLELAAEAGVEFHGVLAGRATWQEGVPIYVKDGRAALEDWMNSVGAQRIEDINRTLGLARPWREARSMQI